MKLVCVCSSVTASLSEPGSTFRCPEHGEMIRDATGSFVPVDSCDHVRAQIQFMVSEHNNVHATFRSVVPTRATTEAAGYDLRAYLPIEPVELKPLSVVVVPTGLRMAMPKDWTALVCSRSGLASRGVLVINAPGIIDSDYRDELRVILSYIAPPDTPPFVVQHGDRIAQLLFTPPYVHPDLVAVEFLPDADSNRTGGFGSTGIK